MLRRLVHSRIFDTIVIIFNPLNHRYDNFDDFSKDASALVRLSCKLIPMMPTLPPKASRPDVTGFETTNMNYNYRKNTLLKSLKLGESKIISMPYDSGSLVNLKLSTKRLTVKMFVSFDGIIPNSRKHDFYTKIKPGKKTGTFVKNPSKYHFNSFDVRPSIRHCETRFC